jgi:hypothetical protein
MSNADEIKPGVTILVPTGADPLRPRSAYRLAVTWVGNVSADGTYIRVNGDLQRLDGSPSMRRTPQGRIVRTFSTPPVLPLAEIKVVER